MILISRRNSSTHDKRKIPLAGCQGVPYCFACGVSRRSGLLSAPDDGNHPEGWCRVHRGGVAAQLQSQVRTRVGVQRSVLGDVERLTGVGLEPEGRVVHGLAVDVTDLDGLVADVPLGGRHRASDDAGVRLGDVLHGRGTLELHGAVDGLGDLSRRRGRRRRGTGQQDADRHRDECDQGEHDDALPGQELRVETVGSHGVSLTVC